MARIILIGGGSSSGKTYVTNRVVEKVGKENVTLISLDDYYKDQKEKTLEERVKTNYDHPKAFDWKLLRSQIKDLKDNKSIEKPKYDFVTHLRKEETEIVKPNKIVIVEGIMALIDAQVRAMGDLKVFIRASAERKFLRRLIRDKEERGRTIDGIVKQYFDTVQPMYEEIIEPSSNYADLIINNDGKKNLSVNILTYLINREIEKENGTIQEDETYLEDEFSKEILEKAF